MSDNLTSNNTASFDTAANNSLTLNDCKDINVRTSAWANDILPDDITEDVNLGFIKAELKLNAKIQYINQKALEYMGYNYDELVRTSGDHIGSFISEDAQKEILAQKDKVIKHGGIIRVQVSAIDNNGEYKYFIGNVTCVKDSFGTELGLYVFEDRSKDVILRNELLEKSKKLALSEKRLQVAIANSDIIMFEYYHDKKMMHNSIDPLNEYGFPEFVTPMPEYVIENGIVDPDSAEDIRNAYKMIDAGEPKVSFVVKTYTKAKKMIWQEITVTNVFDETGKPIVAVGIMQDITTKMEEALRLRKLAQTDMLTGFCNKLATEELIGNILQKASENERHTLMIIDIDNFKCVNDNLGHVFGDAVLKKTAEQLRSVFRDNDILGRIGGDEFMVLLCGTDNKEDVTKKAKKICEMLTRTFRGEKQEYVITVSIGIVTFPKDGKTFQELYHHSDLALYETKARGKNGYFFYQDLDAKKKNGERFDFIGRHDMDVSLHLQSDIRGHILDLLYKAKDIKVTINLILEIIGKRCNASRAYIFETERYNPNYISVIYEWCNEGISPEIDHLQGVDIRQFEDFYDNYKEDGVFYCSNTQSLAPSLAEFLGYQDIHAMLHVIIAQDSEIKGFVGFDDCSSERVWTQEEVELLIFVGKIIGIFLLKKQVSEELVSAYANHKAILDSMDNFTYVVDPETYELLYVNKKTQDLVPESRMGQYCYHAFWGGREEPCEICPLKELLISNQLCKIEIYNEVLDVWTEATASKIPWVGSSEAILINCTDITKYKK